MAPFTSANVAQHTALKRGERSRSPQPQAEEAAAENIEAKFQNETSNVKQNEFSSPLPGSHHGDRGEAGWRLLAPVSAGDLSLQLAGYDGLAVGDVIEISSGTPQAEVVVISRFGSIHLVSPLRGAHPSGAAVRRLIEGTGQRYEEFAQNAGARAHRAVSSKNSAIAASSQDPDLEGFESHGSWSPRERAHQKERFKRRQRASRLASRQMPLQPNLLVSVKQPDKIELENWPSLPMLRSYLQALYAAWRVLTGGGDHAEDYMRLAEEKARGTEAEFALNLEDAYCSEARYSLAEVWRRVRPQAAC